MYIARESSAYLFTHLDLCTPQIYSRLIRLASLAAPHRSDRLYHFKNSDMQVLVATDVAARGLDVKKLNAVLNFDLPRSPSDFVHRIGRVGRAGEEGDAVTFVTEENDEFYGVVCKKNGLGGETEEVEGWELDVEVQTKNINI